MAESVSGEAQSASLSRPRKKGSGTVASLELMRGLASLDVLLWHLLNSASCIPQFPGLYRVVGWSRESVIVFFVLSGYVITLSQQRLHRTALPFFKARVKRIIPIYLIALGASVLVGYITRNPSPPWQIVGHLLFLQSYEGSLVPRLATNAPLWSLGTEFEFYLLFTLILAVRKPVLLFVWGAAAIGGVWLRHLGHVSFGAEGLLLEFLGLSPCWLLGCFFAGFGARYSLTLFQAITLFLMIPMVSYSDYGTILLADGAFDDLKCLFLALLIAPLIHTLAVRQLHPEAKPSPQGWLLIPAIFFVVASWAITHPYTAFMSPPTLVIVLLPVVFYLGAHLLLPDKTSWPLNTAAIRRLSLFLGGSSYALYAIHWPLILLAIACISNQHIRFPALLLIICGAVVVLEFVVQPRAAALIDSFWKTGLPRRAASRLTSGPEA